MKSISIGRVNAVLFLIILTTVILYYGQDFLIPLTFSILLAMLLLPVSRRLESHGVSRIWSTLLSILLILLFVAIIIAIIGAQAVSFSEDLPNIQIKSQKLLEAVQHWIEQRFGVAPEQQIAYLKRGVGNISQSANTYITAALSNTMGLITGFVLTLLYFFFLMWKREKYEVFFLRLVAAENQPTVKKELEAITKVSSQYLIGRLISMVFLAFVYAVGFSVIGLKNGVLLAFVAVIPTIVPYVGAFIGGFFPIIMALITGTPGMVMPVAGVLIAAQVFDNNIIEPLAQGGTLDISPIITIIAIVLGEMIWGVAGMILFIPMFAIVKIICEHIPALSPYGYLLANEMEEPGWVHQLKEWFYKTKSRLKNDGSDQK
jgi:predicted PurR-regulated permease PerM